MLRKALVSLLIVFFLAASTLTMGGNAQAFEPTDWEQLLATNACPGCDLSGANLEGENLEGADLRGAYLAEASLFGANLSGANFEEAYLGRAGWDGANFAQADLHGATWIDGSECHSRTCDERIYDF